MEMKGIGKSRVFYTWKETAEKYCGNLHSQKILMIMIPQPFVKSMRHINQVHWEKDSNFADNQTVLLSYKRAILALFFLSVEQG